MLLDTARRRIEVGGRLLRLGLPALPARVERVDRPLRHLPSRIGGRVRGPAVETTGLLLLLGGARVERVEGAAFHRRRPTAARLLLTPLLLLLLLRLLLSLLPLFVGLLLVAAVPMPGTVEQRPPARGWFRRPAPAGLGPVHGSSSLRRPVQWSTAMVRP
ncbi:hypothetical protein Acsp01_22840 [Actinoplanes sp. NBRC 101535]|nr:hypothetical protein Acsp01_22840 [Actinoplanes sp. NBRC 101535]